MKVDRIFTNIGTKLHEKGTFLRNNVKSNHARNSAIAPSCHCQEAGH